MHESRLTIQPLWRLAGALVGVAAALVACGSSQSTPPSGATATSGTASTGGASTGTNITTSNGSSSASGATGSSNNSSASGPTSGGATGGGRTTGDATGTVTTSASTGGAGPAGLWVYGYWAVWQANRYPLARVAWNDLTHAAISFVEPRAPVATSAQSPYATLDSSNAVGNLGANAMADFANAARAGGTHPLISLGAGVGFAAAASPANQTKFVSDVIAACAQWGYDGVDLDWEDSVDYANFATLVTSLRAAAPPGFLITVPIGAVNVNLGIDADAGKMWASAHGSVDQLNVMTYTGSGAYPGWSVWYMDPLLGEGPDHPFDVASSLAAWAALGIPKSKLGVGIGFYGRAVSAPVTAALQSYGSAKVLEDDSALSYGNITRYFENHGGAVSTWDATAMTGALSWPTEFHPMWTDQYPGDAGPPTQFLTYEDPATVKAKGQWVKGNGYGGAIIWTINEGVQFPYGGDGYANPLLDVTRAAFR